MNYKILLPKSKLRKLCQKLGGKAFQKNKTEIREKTEKDAKKENVPVFSFSHLQLLDYEFNKDIILKSKLDVTLKQGRDQRTVYTKLVQGAGRSPLNISPLYFISEMLLVEENTLYFLIN